LTEKPNGLVLVTGPTGVGKTTTFYAMIDRINSQSRSKIITVEDPIEYLHSHKRSMVIQQEIGKDAKDFHAALMHILRLDPDVICIGEMRDAETISAALLAAETGHLVIATLHTTSAAQTVERIVTAVPPDQKAGTAIQLANVVRGVVTQALLPTVDKKSRVLAYEVMLANAAVRNNIREGRLNHLHDAILAGGEDGMKAMDMRLRELYQAGEITYETALTYAREPRMLLDHAKGKA
ncbi:MAG: Flp pilus assembly complex ATPase component TadA, partial [Elusimicrobia bacterium]|nr:Flp pilus assembly complex ATPase component TadA [Elusimicrobiota bacterium]